MTETARIATRPVRQITIPTGAPWADFRAAYEDAVPHFDRLEAIGVVLSGSGWDGISRLSTATAVHGFVNFFVFDPSPVMAVNGNLGKAVTYLTGNIIKAEAGFRVKPHCFLYLPLRIVIAADGSGNAVLSLDHPVDLFAAYDEPALEPVARDFAQSFTALLEHLGLAVPDELKETGGPDQPTSAEARRRARSERVPS